jgi:hypothetical protein
MCFTLHFSAVVLCVAQPGGCMRILQWPCVDDDSNGLDPCMMGHSVEHARKILAHVQLPLHVTNPALAHAQAHAQSQALALSQTTNSVASAPLPVVPSIALSDISSANTSQVPSPRGMVPQVPVNFSSTPLPSQPASALPSPRTTQRT